MTRRAYAPDREWDAEADRVSSIRELPPTLERLSCGHHIAESPWAERAPLDCAECTAYEMDAELSPVEDDR